MMKRSLSTSSSVVYSLLLQRNPTSVDSCISTLHSNRRRRSLSSDCAVSSKPGDNVKDLGRGGDLVGTQKKILVPKSNSHRFRREYVLSVTNITAWEWCGKQAEFKLQYRKHKDTTPMKEGRARHRQLEEEVSKKAVVKRTKVREDHWASKFLKFIICANKLSSGKMTRGVPIIGIFEDVLMVGVIDEIRMSAVTETIQKLSLVDFKTRSEAKLPHESQKRNGRLQLMCYKYLWDNAVTGNFPTDQFFNYFDLNPGYILHQQHQEGAAAANNGYSAKTLGELVEVYRSKCRTLRPAHDQLILRYEYRKNKELLDEVHFTYDSDWLKDQIKRCLKFMFGEQEADYVSKEDKWKCDTCNFLAACPSKYNT